MRALLLQRASAAEEALAEAQAAAEAATAERDELSATLQSRGAELKARTAELLAIRDGAAAEASVAGSSVQAALDKVRMLSHCEYHVRFARYTQRCTLGPSV